MRKTFLLITILLTILTLRCSVNEKHLADIEYNVLPNLKDSIPIINVKFDYKSDKNGLIVLRYENNSWGDNDIFNCIQDLKVLPEPENIQFIRDSNLITIKTKPHSVSTVDYKIAQDFNGLPLNQYRYRPMIDSAYFHILGMRLFMIPEGIFRSDTSKTHIKINFKEVPGEGIIHSSFGKETVQNIYVNREDLYASYFVGGDFRRYSFIHEGDTIYFMTRGRWKAFTDQEILNLLKQTFSSQRNFWNDPRKGNFSVTLTPTYESWYSVGGSGFSNSFISFASNNDKVTQSHMKWLYNHELLHKWIGRTIINENEVEQYWFSEGFTDYYAYKLMLKNNLIDVTEYIEIINKEVVIPHYKDPLNRIPNADITFENYWSNYAKYMKLPYRRGLLYAFLIDIQIKMQSNYSKSLDNLMIDLFHLSLNDKAMSLNNKVFIQNLLKYLNHPKVEADFEHYIIEGNLIDFQEQLPNGLSIDYQNNVPTLKMDSTDLYQLEKKLKL